MIIPTWKRAAVVVRFGLFFSRFFSFANWLNWMREKKRFNVPNLETARGKQNQNNQVSRFYGRRTKFWEFFSFPLYICFLLCIFRVFLRYLFAWLLWSDDIHISLTLLGKLTNHKWAWKDIFASCFTSKLEISQWNIWIRTNLIQQLDHIQYS